MSENNNDQRTLAILSLVVLLTGIFGSIVLALFDEVVTMLFGAVALIMTIIFGILSWKERLAKIAVRIAVGFIGVFTLLALFFFFVGGRDMDEKREHRLEVNSGPKDDLTPEGE